MRYHPVEFKDASPVVQEIYNDYMKSANAFAVPNWLKSLGSTPALAAAYWQHVKSTLVEGSLPMILKEMVIFIVSVTNGSPYCSAAHAHAVLSLDRSFTYADLVALSQDLDSVALPASMREALKFAVKSVKDPLALTDADWNRLAEFGFSEQELGELIATIALAQIFNTYSMTYNLPIDDDYKPYQFDGSADHAN